ncbi:MAG: hypothetical protein JO170_10620 [Verrucomicrobia bacterium]|nr:hypothetical protein [Verrucomicrobiota bacterium]
MPDPLAYPYYLEALYEEVEYEELFVAELASTAVPDGLPDPSALAQGGGTVGSEDGVPDTSVAAVAADGMSPNTVASGQNIDPATGIRNPDSFTGVPRIDPYNDWVQNAAGTPIFPSPTPDIYENLGPKLSVTPPPDTSQTPPPPPPVPADNIPQPLPLTMLNIAIQQAVGPYDPTAVTPALPQISDVLAGSDWASLLNPPYSPPAPLSNDQPEVLTQILSGTYVESVFQNQLMNEGQPQIDVHFDPMPGPFALGRLAGVLEPELWQEIAKVFIAVYNFFWGGPDSKYNPDTPPDPEYPTEMPELPDPLPAGPPPPEPAEPETLGPSEDLGLSEEEANVWEDAVRYQAQVSEILDSVAALVGDLLGDVFPPILTDSSGNLIGWGPGPGGRL